MCAAECESNRTSGARVDSCAAQRRDCRWSPALAMERTVPTMKTLLLATMLAVAVASCTNYGPPTRVLFPDCSQVSAEKQAESNCMYRPEPVDNQAGGGRR